MPSTVQHPFRRRRRRCHRRADRLTAGRWPRPPRRRRLQPTERGIRVPFPLIRRIRPSVPRLGGKPFCFSSSTVLAGRPKKYSSFSLYVIANRQWSKFEITSDRVCPFSIVSRWSKLLQIEFAPSPSSSHDKTNETHQFTQPVDKRGNSIQLITDPPAGAK